MAGAPIKLHGLSPLMSNRLASRNPLPAENVISSNLSREQIIAILFSNGIEEAKIRTKKAEMAQLLHRLIVERGAEVCDPEAEEIEFDRQQALNGVPRPKNCCVCMGRTCVYLFEICRHLCLCSTCKYAMLREPNLVRMYPDGQRQIHCPMCRQLHDVETQLLRVIYNDA